MIIENNTSDQIMIIKVKGEIDIYTADHFKETIEKAIQEKAAEILLDCSELTYIDSIGMGVLIEMRNKTQEMGKKIILKDPKENIKKLLTLTGVDRIIDIHESHHSGS